MRNLVICYFVLRTKATIVAFVAKGLIINNTEILYPLYVNTETFTLYSAYYIFFFAILLHAMRNSHMAPHRSALFSTYSCSP